MTLLLRLARRDAARGALRSAEHLLAAAAGAGAETRLAPAVTAEQVTVLTLVGRAADALALGAAELDGLRGDAHAELCLQLARTAVTAGAWADAEAYVARAGRPGDPRSLVLRADAAFGAGRAADAGGFAAAAIAPGRAGPRRARARAPTAGAARPRPRSARRSGWRARLAWGTDLDVTEALARRAAQVAGEHGLVPWRVTALFQLGMMSMLRAHDTAPLLQARELALDAGMLGQVAAIDYVRADYTWWVDGPAAALPMARASVELDPRPAPAAARLQRPLDARDARRRRRSSSTARPHRRRCAGAPTSIASQGGGGPRLEQVLRVVVALAGARPAPRGRRAGDRRARGAAAKPALIPPLPYLGASALVARRDRPGGRARRSAPTPSPRSRPTAAPSPGPTPSRPAAPAAATRPPPCSPRATPRSPACPGGGGCCAPSCSTAPSPTAGAIPCRPCAPTSPSTSRRATSCSPAPAVTCSAAPGPRPRAPAAGAAVAPRLRAHGITARESEVLGLVAEGLTNVPDRRAAVPLARTVDTHVANLLAKTGARSRTQLRVWAGEPR